MHSISKPISPETISQAGAGVLLAVTGAVELWLTHGAAAWWYRGGASVVAAAGLFLVIRILAAVASPLRTELAERVARAEAARRVVIARR